MRKGLAMLYLVDRCCNTLPQLGWEELGQGMLVLDTSQCYSQLVHLRLSGKLNENHLIGFKVQYFYTNIHLSQ